MGYAIRMGIPEMEELWNSLQKQYRDGSINKKDGELYKKWGNALKKLSEDPMYPSLRSHEKSGARRMYWVYGPDRQEITIIGLEPHPENTKNGAYDRIKLSGL